MKTSRLLALAILLPTLFVGCRTAGVYDPDKTAALEDLIIPDVSFGVTQIIQNNKPIAPQLGDYFRAVGGVFAEMVSTKQFDPDYLVKAVDRATAQLQAGLPAWAFLLKNTITKGYKLLFDSTKASLSDEKWPIHFATILAGGIHQGLVDAGQPGLLPNAAKTLKLARNSPIPPVAVALAPEAAE